MLVSRLYNLAHVLIWNTSNINSTHLSASIDIIELTWVNLKFKLQKVASVDGNVKNCLYSNDNDGLYISTSTEA